MPKKKELEAKTALGEARDRQGRRPFLALLSGVLAILVFVALIDFQPSQSSNVTTAPAGDGNLVGDFGSFVGFWSFRLLGIAAWLLPPFILRLAYLFYIGGRVKYRFACIVLMVISTIALCGLGNMAQHDYLAEAYAEDFTSPTRSGTTDNPYYRYTAGHGGLVGDFLYATTMRAAVGPFGSGFIYGVSFLVALTLAFLSDPRESAVKLVDRIRNTLTSSKEAWKKAAEERARLKQERMEREAEEAADSKADDDKLAEKLKNVPKREIKSFGKMVIEDEDDKDGIQIKDTDEAEEALSAFKDGSKEKKTTKKAAKKRVEKEYIADPEPEDDIENEEPELVEKAPAAKKATPVKEEPEVHGPASVKVILGEKVERVKQAVPQKKGDYEFPTLDLLQDPPEAAETDAEDYQETADALVRTLGEFKVEVNLGEVHSGPVITRYEVTPAPGVRVEKIESLDKNIALGLKALAVRILAPVPGKGTVGVEVPNKDPLPVCLREIVESKAWADSKSEIPIVLGKEVTGKPVVVDLTKMPHMLIAGSTGSGKTVCINAVIASLLYKMSPDDVRFIMVDPKVVEMKVYNSLPHMLIPVVTDPKKVPGALKWLLNEMERRYNIFAEVGVRNIAGFNAKILKDKDADAKAAEMESQMTPEERAAVNQIEVPRDPDAFEIPNEKLPYIVCIIDELADLMMVAPADIETGIARLAQLARAAGIHLILATQRPSVNVITGVIKANLPCRIAFKVASNTDSRTILDQKGAEALIGKGDMLFIPPGTSNLVRAQGAFVSDDEINGIVDYLKRNGEPVFAEDVQRQIESGGEDDAGGGAEGEWDDDLVPDAINVIKNSKRASTSMLQRRLKIGYNRAARIMEILEDEGMVGPENGSSPREILMDLD